MKPNKLSTVAITASVIVLALITLTAFLWIGSPNIEVNSGANTTPVLSQTTLSDASDTLVNTPRIDIQQSKHVDDVAQEDDRAVISIEDIENATTLDKRVDVEERANKNNDSDRANELITTDTTTTATVVATTATAAAEGVNSGMEIVFDESKLHYIAELPDAAYSVGVRLKNGDIPDPATVKWSSSNLDVFDAIWNGSIKPTGVGTATIYAEFEGEVSEKNVIISQGAVREIVPGEESVVRLHRANNGIETICNNIDIYALASNGNLFFLPDEAAVEWESREPHIANQTEKGLVLINEGTTVFNVAWGAIKSEIEVTVINVENCVLEATQSEVLLRPGLSCDVWVYAVNGQGKTDVTDIATWEVVDGTVVQAGFGFIDSLCEGQTDIIIRLDDKELTIPVTVKHEETYSDITLYY